MDVCFWTFDDSEELPSDWVVVGLTTFFGVTFFVGCGFFFVATEEEGKLIGFAFGFCITLLSSERVPAKTGETWNEVSSKLGCNFKGLGWYSASVETFFKEKTS